MRDQDGDLERYLQVLTGGDDGGWLIEIRYRRQAGMGQRFVPVARIAQAAAAIRSLAPRRDTFVGVLPRVRRGGRLEDVAQTGGVAWVDCDTPAASRALAAFPRRRRWLWDQAAISTAMPTGSCASRSILVPWSG